MDYNKIFENEKFMNRLGYLYSRWLDECMYEDIDEYAEAIIKAMQEANGTPFEVSDVVGTEDPFGVQFTTSNGKRWQVYAKETGEDSFDDFGAELGIERIA